MLLFRSDVGSFGKSELLAVPVFDARESKSRDPDVRELASSSGYGGVSLILRSQK